MNIKIKREHLLATTMIAGIALAGFAAPAAAQSTPSQDAQVEDIIVTGSRIRQPNLTTTSPVTQVTGEDIDLQGVTRVEDLVSQLPQAFAAQNSTVANGSSGTATVSLRNLGSSRTLVLIDGRRMGYGSPLDDAADLNQIPGQLVERVEVLTGGASAVYGSDAIAGVVNFIMRRDFEGLEIDASYGFYQHGNDYDGVGNLRNVIAGRAQSNPSQFQLPDDNVQTGFSREINAILGVSTDDGRGNITAYAGYRKNNKVLQRDYDYSACALGAPSAAAPSDYTCGGSGTSFPGQFTDFVNFAYTVDANGNFVPYVGAQHAYNFGPLNYFQRPDERYVMGAFGRYQVNDKVELFTQLMFSDYSSVAQIAPSGNFFSTSTINCGNPLLSAQQSGLIGCSAADIAADNPADLYIARRNVEGGGRQADFRYQSYRAVVGARGALNDSWSYDVAAQYSRVQLSQIYRNEFSTQRLLRALDVVDDGAGNAVCRSVMNGVDPDCVPYNVFRSNGVTQEALDYLQVPLIMTGWTTQQAVTASMTGDLTEYGFQMPWADRGVQVAFGVEYRRDALDLTPDVSFQTGDGAGQGGPTLGLNGANQVYDVFGEAQIPLISDQPGFYSANIDLAFRHSEYDLGGGTDSWKVGGDWAPVPDVRFRTSFQRAVRAPNVIELFTSQGFNLFDMDADPCGDVSGTSVQQASLAACQATGVPTAMYGTAALNSPAGQYNFLQGGNPALTPEESETFTLGFVLQPSALPGFNLTVDYFDIQIENLVSSVGALNAIDACYANNVASACSLIQRNAGGQLWVGAGHVQDLNTNIGGLRTSGIDFQANYGVDLNDWGVSGAGSLGFSFVATWLKELETDTGLGFSNSVYDCAGFYANQCGVPNPEWRHRFRVDWNTPIEGLNIAGTWRHYGEVEVAVLGNDGSLNNGGARLDRYFDAENYFDIAGTWQLRDNVRLRAGVNNVFDNDPQLSLSVGTTGNGNTYPQLYDSMGRYFFFGITADF